LADSLRRRLEEEIVAGRLKSGERLDEHSLARRFRVSRTPVREALRQLAASGLVERRPRQGSVVATITIPGMIELFEVMAELESMCARLAARRMTPEERQALKAVHEACGRLVKKGDPDAYYTMNTRFHEAIYAGAHNRTLEDMTRGIRNRLTAYRRYQLHQAGRLANSFAEHHAVLNAILRGDAETAGRLMQRHVNIQGDVFADFVSSLSSASATG
jgi:DNA-binding GntR family transcriptional regulator